MPPGGCRPPHDRRKWVALTTTNINIALTTTTPPTTTCQHTSTSRKQRETNNHNNKRMAQYFKLQETVEADFKLHETIEANFFGEGKYYVGTIAQVSPDGKSYDIQYSDGDFEARVDAKYIRSIGRRTIKRTVRAVDAAVVVQAAAKKKKAAARATEPEKKEEKKKMTYLDAARAGMESVKAKALKAVKADDVKADDDGAGVCAR
eukprot:SAG31_NODE_3069_length_4721_cov_2.812852_4_plen_205_part_00